jgi:hypothetical protein
MRVLKLSLLFLGAYFVIASQLITYAPQAGARSRLNDFLIGAAILLVAFFLPSNRNHEKAS